MNNQFNKNGFSLVELLITISIIAVLSALGLIAYTAVLQQGRDSKRQSDLRSIQSALEQYNSDQGFYPASISPGNILNNCTGISVAVPCTVSKTYMNTIPNDSNATFPYQYTALPSTPSACSNLSTGVKCTGYCLFAKLDIDPSPAITPTLGCSMPVVGTTTYNYLLTPP